MLVADQPWREPTPDDLNIYHRVVPVDHKLRRLIDVIDWDSLHDQLAPFYSPTQGRPADPPVMYAKFELLRYFYNLSDREVIDRAETDLAFRYFLNTSLGSKMPNPSSLTKFRGRIGVEGFRGIFNHVVAEARRQGIVKDRLRLKDATHVLANIAVPSARALVAQTRDKLLEAARPFAAELVEGELVALDLLRQDTQTQSLELQLATRVKQLQDILAWADEVTPPEDADKNRPWQTFLAQRDLAHKILHDNNNPGGGDRTLSTVDSDARCGKHGKFYDGYLFDMAMDADSEIITNVNVLPANGNEAADAAELIRQEEQTHGNDVEAISIDGIGFNGPVLRDLQDPEGLNLEVYVPPTQEPETKLHTPDQFIEVEGQGVVCPAGKTSSESWQDKNATVHRFSKEDCQPCPLLALCMKAGSKGGRTVRKSHYEHEYSQARAKATTQAYQQVRSEHAKVERKLGEVMNRHGGRRAKYFGRCKVLIQELMASTATNLKRMLQLGCAPTAAISCEM